jgi:RimJ/RimL family protein N-acetyltransferase
VRTVSSYLPPERIETQYLVLRVWEVQDAPLLNAAVEFSLEHLRAWLPWAMSAPSPLEETRQRLTDYQERFFEGEEFVFGIFDPGETQVVGGCGLHPRIGPGGLEIGYWIRADEVGQGFATEAAKALTEAGFGIPDIDRIQIHCDPENIPSRRVPEKLGYVLAETRIGDEVTPNGEVRDSLIFEITRDQYLSSQKKFSRAQEQA